ncbi:MAG TPA: DUF748 domain-containing protein, partial [Ramlibacter sp.]|nr:DUF748 domain-containing protein [Ramlibacter sp.]
MVIRWKRWAGIAAAAVAVYAALGFWAVPWVAKRELASYARDQLQRQASVGDLRFNPFTLRLEAADLKLDEADGAPIAGIGHLAVELQWRSLLSRAWRFAEIGIERPTVSLAIAPDGRFNMAELIASATRGSQPSPAKDASLPRMIIERFAITGGRIDMQDRHAGYSNTFAPVAFELTDFSTLPDRNDEYKFTAASKTGGSVRWKGHASVNPIRATGELAIDNVSLPQLSVYLKSKLPATVAAGHASATLPYAVSYADGRFEARLLAARVAAQEVAISQAGTTASFTSLGAQLSLVAGQRNDTLDMKITDASLALDGVAVSRGDRPAQKLTRIGFDGGTLDLAARRAALERFYVDGGHLHLARDRAGVFDLANWVPKREAPSASTAAPAGPSWTADVHTIQLDKLDADIADEQTGVKLQVVDAHAKLEGAGTNLKQPIQFDAGLSLREGGEIHGEGSVVPSSGAVQAQLSVSKLSLKPLQPLLAQYVKLKIAGGAVSARGKFATGSGRGKDAALHYDGSFGIDNVLIRELDGVPF